MQKIFFKTFGCRTNIYDTELLKSYIKDYEIYVSQDGKNWGSPIAKGTFPDGSKQQRVDFAQPVRARYIRFKALSSQNGQDFASAAEFKLIAD